MDKTYRFLVRRKKKLNSYGKARSYSFNFTSPNRRTTTMCHHLLFYQSHNKNPRVEEEAPMQQSSSSFKIGYSRKNNNKQNFSTVVVLPVGKL
jgi:hypothetical protein